MPRRPIRIATTRQLERSVREAGHQVFLVPQDFDRDFNRPLERRIAGGAFMKRFLEANDIELILDFNTEPLPDSSPGPVVAFMGHPAASWFLEQDAVLPGMLFHGLTAAAVHADMPDMPFHRIYYDMYEFDTPPLATDGPVERARESRDYYQRKFIYNAFLAVKQGDCFACFLKKKLGDRFQLIGDSSGHCYHLPHTPREWDIARLHQRIREVPICLNLMKGNIEFGLIVRHFKVTSHGRFLLTCATDQLSQFFEIGEECDVFHNEQELLEKIDHYLHNPERRREIALAGQQRTLSEHLYSHRVQRVVDHLFPTVSASDRNAIEGVTVRTDAARETGNAENAATAPGVVSGGTGS
ncbi:MAG: glycosyltransferase family protein [Planctomycetota bacterium]|jgi:hypothetical protein